jgi:hypothetical protein
VKINVYVTAIIGMDEMIIDVPKNATKEDVIRAVKEEIERGRFYADNIPELRYIEDNNTGEIYYDD